MTGLANDQASLEAILKDEIIAERVQEVLVEDVQALVDVLEGSGTAGTVNLPAQPTASLGREHELAEALELLRRAGTRLLTLTGPGGSGKTRLSLELAAGVANEYPDGVWFVPLAALTDPALVVPTIAQRLGVRETPNAS